ncbi:hypothetical protein [Thalassobaculum salexigens]|uniref:hypothetical protein n=1 Tax=Thalassobaculum salexigens TaxID=455360 RepID=UPI00041FE3B6|nr:hypothetical protein [Thalassobaculum salexigens]
MKGIKPAMAGVLTALLLAACQTTSGSTTYSWPSFQSGLRLGPSSSPVKAELPPVKLTPAAPTITPAHAAYGGIWEGWMCRDRVVDLKIAVTEVTDAGATVSYASGSTSFGSFEHPPITARFSGDVLRGTFRNGVDLILGMRSDGNMNVKYDAENWCTGILRNTAPLPKA